ncbi:hypothetical protein NT2_13_00810 [Caenibius tardaugens NBRC 16725]|uniref:Uncharacterized protein n=1 Tax=Caenibius tardaugens NBRC 16725 TaxID=1219035 RepID=U3A023_9SPHN|nr:hypothetical protein [Caenibius tardaugens]AZI37878.1 hypothetical protein EGO55_19505 [Caenibius tardaugens NBRC 16725]GAD50994.1 hypothetical protein NT2_13_00810 [Caenibius tardaugens NBRC 16725]
MNAALRAEGQSVVIIGDREALQNPTGQMTRVVRYVNTVTTNADGSVGYQLEGDLPRAQTSTSVCVGAKLTNVRLYDARQPVIPQAVFLGGQFDALVRANAAKGNRPMMLADTVHSAPGGGERRGLPLVMFGDPQDMKTASQVTQLSDGRPQFLVGMSDTDYTSAGLARLNAKLASREP